ncbi:hypothetical protein ABW21_db0201401 [Orbilia brochopaga]|nr:hypothetical protein ABW21_db0201401 [Drechslerella brochopaga]
MEEHPDHYPSWTFIDPEGNTIIQQRPYWRLPLGTPQAQINAKFRGLKLELQHCQECLCDEQGNLLPNGGCWAMHTEICKSWYNCECFRELPADPVADPVDAIMRVVHGIKDNSAKTRWFELYEDEPLPGDEGPSSGQREQRRRPGPFDEPRPRPGDLFIGLDNEAIDRELFEMTADRREVEGTAEPYQVEGRSRSRRTWDWFRRSLRNIVGGAGVRVLDRTFNRGNGRLRGSRPPGWNGKGRMGGKGLKLRKREADVLPDGAHAIIDIAGREEVEESSNPHM